jgi:Cu(I)/Ag(I) efflux system membrane fusion protein
MKTKPFFFPLLLAVVALASVQCKAKKESAGTPDHSDQHASGQDYTLASEPIFNVDVTFRRQLTGVFTSYVALQEAFVSSDAAKAKAESGTMLASLGRADGKLLTGAAHHDWGNYLNELNASLQAIQAADDIEVQREAFSTLSDNLYKAIRAYGMEAADAYYVFCPMAFDNQGAFWLSNEVRVRNPYFGSKMLTCGEIREKLK